MILPWDKLVTLALAGYTDATERLFNSVIRHGENAPNLFDLFADEVRGGFDEEFASLLADLEMASYLNGAAEPLGKLTIKNLPLVRSWRGDYYKQLERIPRVGLWDGISFPSETKVWRPVAEKAVEAVKQWNVVKRDDFDQLADAQRSRAWTITGINSQKALEKIRQSVATLPDTGASRIQWYHTVKQEFDKSALGPARAELVYRVASTRMWAEGAAKTVSNPVITNLLPYVKVYTINDSRRTIACRMMSRNGINGSAIYRKDDPAYIHNRTPRHYNCRCHDSYMTVAQAARAGVPEAIEWQKTGKPPEKPYFVPYFEVPMPPGWIPLPYGVAA